MRPLTSPTATAAVAHRVPPEAAFAIGGVSQYAGAAIAIELFDEGLDPAAVAFFRVLTAGLAIVLLRRAWHPYPQVRRGA